MNNKIEEVKEESRELDINSAISQKISELQKLVSQLQDHGCLFLYAYNEDQDDSKGVVKGLIHGKGLMIKRALEQLAKNDPNFRSILARAYFDSITSDDADSIVEQMLQHITEKDDE